MLFKYGLDLWIFDSYFSKFLGTLISTRIVRSSGRNGNFCIVDLVNFFLSDSQIDNISGFSRDLKGDRFEAIFDLFGEGSG